MERDVVQVLKFKLLPDTLYFWFDLAVQLWDIYVSREAAHLGYQVFKPQEASGRRNLNRYEPKLHRFQLGSDENRYRVGIQALDLMSLDFELHEFSRPNLVLAMLALLHMQETKLLAPYPHYNELQLQEEVRDWANCQIDAPDAISLIFKQFLDLYCLDMLPENFDTSLWTLHLAREMCFASQFFTFNTQLSEP